MTGKLGFDDLEVGMRFRSSDRVVTAEEIVAFAKDFDPQPVHTDPGAAPATVFGGHVASGWHTSALTMRLVVESLPIDGA